jgi:hypothetical protein
VTNARRDREAHAHATIQTVKLDGGVFLLQWATGGLLFAWVTTRRREVGLGYGWLLRIVFGTFAIGGAVVLAAEGPDRASEKVAFACAVLTAAAAIGVLGVSVARRRAGVSGAVARREKKRSRVSAMLGRAVPDVSDAPPVVPEGTEFDPRLDLIAPVIGAIGLVVAAQFSGGPALLAGARLLVGAAFLGCVSDAMLLGHWYLVQPGLPRDAVKQLVRLTAFIWPVEVAVMLWPTGMVQVLNGTVDDGWKGILGWTWLACSVGTIALVGLTWAALRERSYSAVMAATGLLYLAILTAFGTDLLARAVLRP